MAKRQAGDQLSSRRATRERSRVVEVAPAYDHAQITALAAAQIGFEFLALYATRPGGPMGVSQRGQGAL